jgi:NADPH-dependent 2,4-dienoyl-CoA reductase/sulfur reductase-like enzyme
MVKRLGLGGTAAGLGMLTGRGFADETDGDPAYAGFARNIRVVEPSMQDVPSARLEGGKVIQPARELPIFHTADVVVVGGGPAGFGAAVAASRAGAKVALIERYGSLGGLFTNGMVLIIIGTGVKENGQFKLVTRGVCEEFMRRLEAMGEGAITKLEPNIGQPTADPEAAKFLMDEMVQEARSMFFSMRGG